MSQIEKLSYAFQKQKSTVINIEIAMYSLVPLHDH